MALEIILNLKVTFVPKHNCFYSMRYVAPKLVGNDTSCALLANLVQELPLFLIFNMVLRVGGYFEKRVNKNTFPPFLGGA